jgi:hypothetical protein
VITSKEPKTITIKEGDDQYEALRHDYLGGLIQEFVLTGDHEKLKLFVSEGGDIDSGTTDNQWIRELLAENYFKEIPGKKGGPRDTENIKFYMDVERYLLGKKWSSPKKKRNLAAALRQVGKDRIEPGELDDRAVKRADKTFRKGKKLFIARCGRPYITETNTEN